MSKLNRKNEQKTITTSLYLKEKLLATSIFINMCWELMSYLFLICLYVLLCWLEYNSFSLLRWQTLVFLFSFTKKCFSLFFFRNDFSLRSANTYFSIKGRVYQMKEEEQSSGFLTRKDQNNLLKMWSLKIYQS